LRVPFGYVFRENQGGEMICDKAVDIYDVLLAPDKDLRFASRFSDYDIEDIVGRDLEIEEGKCKVKVFGFYE